MLLSILLTECSSTPKLVGCHVIFVKEEVIRRNNLRNWISTAASNVIMMFVKAADSKTLLKTPCVSKALTGVSLKTTVMVTIVTSVVILRVRVCGLVKKVFVLSTTARVA